MIVKIPLSTKTSIGGGQSFVRNLKKSLLPFGHKVIHEGEGDILLIAGATLVERSEVEAYKQKGKRIVLRVDNILEDSKNRNSGMSRLVEYAKLADVIVYQSEWAERLLKPLLGEGIVIYNGVDTDIFYPKPFEDLTYNQIKDRGLRVFYGKFSRNETKRVHEMQYWWREYNLEDPNGTMILAGRFADDYLKIDHPFEFFNGEQVEFHGVCDPEKLATIMRSCDVAFLPYAFDACSNTVIEAQACGLPVIYNPTGGTPEIVKFGIENNYGAYKPSDMVRFALDKRKEWQPENIKNQFGLETMGERYHALFSTVMATIYEI